MPKYIFTGKIDALAIGDIPDAKENRLVDEIIVTRAGIAGDRHGGEYMKSKPWRQPYLPQGTEIVNLSSLNMTSTPELKDIATSMEIKEIQPGWLSENIVISELTGLNEHENKKISLTQIPAGARFVFSKNNPEDSVVLLNMMLNPPCGIPGRNIQRYFPDEPNLGTKFKIAAQGKRGLILTVEKEGIIKVGDEFKIYIPDEVTEGWENFLNIKS